MEDHRNAKDACRLCDKNTDQMFSVFDKTGEGHQILHLIKECLPVIIYRTDPLSKRVCEGCYKKLGAFYKFKKTSIATADKHLRRLKDIDDNASMSVQLYLACEEPEMNNVVKSSGKSSVGTSTDGLTVSCASCKSTCFDASIVNNEVELCAELHKAIADSLSNNKVMTHSEGEKRSRRRRSQAFYHELDDSLCSSLTEFTNTESSQCFEEYHSDMDSYESDQEGAERAKRPKLDPQVEAEEPEEELLLVKEVEIQNTQVLKDKFKDDLEYRYFPLSLMSLALNVINMRNVPDYEPDDFYVDVIEPRCTYCKQKFKNSKLLALHEVDHVNIELGEKVDNPIPWHESRDDADVRNKWLSSYDEVECEEETAEDFMECEVELHEPEAQSLLIPVGTEIPQEHLGGEIVLENTKPFVHGIALCDYSKEERKGFYKSMRIGGVNKKFCPLCRYSFKDNWAIESHYFSSACYYTCRYCGMRFNKQRHRFEEHVREHEDRGDSLSIKIYAASKLNNVVPKVIQPEKVKKMLAQQDLPDPPIRILHSQPPQPLKMRAVHQRRSLQPNLQIKEEPQTDIQPVQNNAGYGTKTSNQAYFCRKCYKVFFKLDEFNVHSKNCDYNQFPAGRNNSTAKGKLGGTNGDVVSPPAHVVSPTGRPVRNCVVREVGTYKDETFIPENVVKEVSPSQQSFVCFICNTPFPTIYSRNSHMRIHKGETSNNSPSTSQRPKQNYYSQPQNPEPVRTYSNYINDVNIKQEPLEPEVQIHESEQNYNSNVAAVSITPISKNPNQKATINPNIMKLVQNNPHLTIKANMNQSPERQPPSAASSAVPNNSLDADKSYKCSSCWEAFSNKSHLYFHKKNQCEGSKYPCPFCKKRFGTEAAYSSHIFYSHPE